MKRNKCALLVVEGKKTEPSIFKYIFEKYGYTFVELEKEEGWDNYKVNIDSSKTIYLIQGDQNRLNNFLDSYGKYDTISQKYGIEDVVAFNYIIYDFDYVRKDKMKSLQEKFISPQEGELILSNPCIEVIADNKFEKHVGRSTLYKRKINKQITDLGYRGQVGMRLTESYIIDHFEDLMINHIRRNCEQFQSTNVVDHPSMLIDYVMNTNISNEDEELFEFHYLATVVYVAIAELEGLTKEFDNADLIIEYFKKKQIHE